ncbi:MAG TPA: transposase [Pyrinomonadaceae bacterium]|nr:transposase [Pyrinomonadaceae bacterium]
MQARQLKGLEIATHRDITRDGNIWLVPSENDSTLYRTDIFLQTCTCPDFEKHKLKCKHLYAVEFLLQRESGMPLPVPPDRRERETFKQAWHEYNLAQINEKSKFQELLYALCQNVEELPRKGVAGRNRLPLGEMIFCVVFKTYSLFSGRRFISDLQEAQRRGYISRTPHFNSIFNYLELPVMTELLKSLIAESSLPLKSVETEFAVDSSGFSTGQFVRWFDVKYGNTEDWHDWIKLHLMCGVRTHIVTSVEISERYSHDSLYFKPLVNATAASGFNIQAVSADKAYSSRPNLRLVEKHGGKPYIAFKDNARGDSKCKVWNRLFHYYSLHRDEYMKEYHKRSNSESTFSMIKAKFSERIRSKTATAQVNEALCKVLAHNICTLVQSMYELGIEPDF